MKGIAVAQRFSQILSPDAPPAFEKSRVTGCQEFLKEKDSTLAFCQMPFFQMPLAKRPVPLENR
jgi:hypothetical protein